MTARTMQFDEPLPPGSYRIISAAAYKEDNVLVVTRGSEMFLIRIPLAVLTCRPEHIILEIVEGGGFRLPKTRPVKDNNELSEIDSYVKPGGTTRS